MQFSQADFSAVAFSPLQTNKGVKTANATLRGGLCEFLLHPSEWFQCPFGASTFDKDPQATRLTCELDVTNSSVLPLLQQMDRWAVQAVADSGLFEGVSKEDVARMYHPCLQTSENTIRSGSEPSSTRLGSTVANGSSRQKTPPSNSAIWTYARLAFAPWSS